MFPKYYALLAAATAVVATHTPRHAEPDPTPKKIIDLGPGVDMWRAYDAPSRAFYIADESERLQILRPNGSEIAHIDNIMDASVDAKRDRIVFLRSSDPAGTPVNWNHLFVWLARLNPATGQILEAPHRVSIHPCDYIEISPDGARTLCARRSGETWTIFTFPSTGGDEHAVVTRQGRTFEPLWSADGKWILYSAEGGPNSERMERVSSNGGTPEPFAGPGRPIGFSPDGKYFAVGTNKGPTVRIFNADGRLVTTVLMPHFPSWSTTMRHGLVAGVNDAPSTLKSVSFPGGAIRELPKVAAWQGDPAFTPDGKHLVFRATVGGRDQFEIADRDGKHARALAMRVEPLAYLVAPDSRSITFVSKRLDSAYVVDIESGTLRALMPLPRGTMAWRSDGRAVLYATEVSPGDRQIRQHTLDGHDTLVRDVGAFGAPGAIQSIADTLLISADHAGLHLLSLATGAARTVVSGRASAGCIECRFTLSPDGRFVGFELDDSTGAGTAFIASLDGKQKAPVGQPLRCGASPFAWHPNGRDLFLYGFTECDTTELTNIYAASRDGGPMRNLTATETPGSVEGHAAHPDGSQIVYAVDGVNRGSIYTLDLSRVLP